MAFWIIVLILVLSFTAAGGWLMDQLQKLKKIADKLGKITANQWPKVRNLLLGVAGITLVLIAMSLGVMFVGVAIGERFELILAGVPPKEAAKWGVGTIKVVVSNIHRLGVGICIVWFALTLYQSVISVPQSGRASHFVRHSFRSMAPIFIGLALWWFNTDLRNLLLAIVTEGEPTYFKANLAVGGGALIAGPWLMLVSAGFDALAWAVKLGVKVVGGVVLGALDALVNAIAAFGLAKKVDHSTGDLTVLKGWGRKAIWPWVIIWFVASAITMVFPRLATLLGMVPVAVFCLAMFSIIIERGWDQYFTRIMFGVIAVLFFGVWPAKLGLPLTTGMTNDAMIVKRAEPRGVLEVGPRVLDEFLACDYVPEYLGREVGSYKLCKERRLRAALEEATGGRRTGVLASSASTTTGASASGAATGSTTSGRAGPD